MNKLKKGKYGEYSVILRLLKEGLNIYPTLVDDIGVDLIIKNKYEKYIEIQIKSVWEERNKQWFQIQTKTDENLIRDNFFIIGIDKEQNSWIFPSNIFFNEKYCNKSPKNKKSNRYTFDLKLNQKHRGNKKSNLELLANYKENWQQLIDYGKNVA